MGINSVSACVHRSPDDGSWWYHLIGLGGSGGSYTTRDEAIADAREVIAEIIDDMVTTGANYRNPRTRCGTPDQGTVVTFDVSTRAVA